MYGGNALSDEYFEKMETIDKVRKTNREALAYWNGLYE